jgi:UDP-N-acetylglucosamine 2-epimerase (non-hydrolysing)
MKLMFVFGTRPEGIKMAPMILEAKRRSGVVPIVVSTGQHREMLRPILELFQITPDVDLDLMRPNQTLGGLTARAIEAISALLEKEKPDVLVSQGDTTTAMCGALAAFYQQVPVAHLEAGLRSDRLDAPFPEEMNRRVIGQVATWHFPPTQGAKQNLLRDRVDIISDKIIVTGNTVIDALLMARENLAAHPLSSDTLREVDEWKATRPGGGRLLLVTGHRRENFGAPFREFCRALADLADQWPDVLLVYPVHLNPNVQAPVKEILGDRPNIRLVPPAGYPEFVALMQQADLIITDSGGVQEEAPALGKPVLVTRDVTERPEAVEAGAVELVGPHRDAIVKTANAYLSGEKQHRPLALEANPYGDGQAAKRCLDALLGVEVVEF